MNNEPSLGSTSHESCPAIEVPSLYKVAALQAVAGSASKNVGKEISSERFSEAKFFATKFEMNWMVCSP